VDELQIGIVLMLCNNHHICMHITMRFPKGTHFQDNIYVIHKSKTTY